MRRSLLTTLCSAYPILCLLAAVPACDDPDQLPVDLDDDDDDDDDVAAREWSMGEGDGAADEDPCPNLPDLPDLPLSANVSWEILAPFRMDDLKPNHYAAVGVAASGRWHDLGILRRDGGWKERQPGGGSGEDKNVSWGTPVYAGIDGEVMACWRTAPYDADYLSVAHKLGSGGNFLLIKSATGNRWLLYSHLDTNTIPAALCPHVSTDGGYMTSVSTDMCDPNNPVNIRVCPLSGCTLAEAYIGRFVRPQVRAGQFIGRVGATGNAKGAHLHMQAGLLDVDGIVDRQMTDKIQLSFEHSWQAPVTGTAPPSGWTPSSNTDLKNAAAVGNVLVWPGHARTLRARRRGARAPPSGCTPGTSTATVSPTCCVTTARPAPWPSITAPST